MHRFLEFILFACCLLLTFSCSGDDATREELKEDFSEIMARIGSETGIPGVAVYVKTSTYGDFSLAWGMADLDAETPVRRDQPFRIGSLTKSFTAAAVLLLAERGLIELDAPITEYLGLVNGYTPLEDISVRQLLNMGSGLAPYLSIPFITESVLAHPEQNYDPEELLAEAFDVTPEHLFIPGSEFLYTNTNYILLGMLVEYAAGMSYADFITDALITPLGLNETRVMVDSGIPSNLALGYYDYDEDGRYEDWTAIHMSYVWSAGCIVSTARDVAVWMDTLARGDLLTESFRPFLLQGQYIDEGVVYGAGILDDKGFGIGHNGTVIGYHADAWHDPVTGVTVAVLSNTNAPLLSDERDPTREIAAQILAQFY